ncbi:hypothetical protein JCM3775_002407 [Rhodotorula graminis]|uniref:tRNA N(3)-methylcytidine methyltransferase n=1 Tax=Rhodotorula graminis (strain WP1) TaxID=578459 RepID=A0A194S7Z5_RHOGW|nr:uncharacterized protein RHOBADRAFT_51713 [Rhodotorula graminis WP1]KPV76712.1 hypothetical protein RHOBADRAFT_51713 [Rhodotorula graminis WP1]
MAQKLDMAPLTRANDQPAASTSTSPPPSSSSAPAFDSTSTPTSAPKKARKPRIVLEGTTDEILARNNKAAEPRFVDKLFSTAGKQWNQFYKHHAATPFFKDRHWTLREWPQLAALGNAAAGHDADELGDSTSGSRAKGKGKAVLEVGCGTGAFIYPLLEQYPSARFVAFDFAKKAVELTLSNANHDPVHCHIFQHDLTAPRAVLDGKLAQPPPEFGEPVLEFDFVSAVFVLSALDPAKQAKAMQTLVSLLAPGGSLLFRDYALHDAAQLRFHSLPSASYAANPSLLSDSLPLYRRGDNTLTYFFTADDVRTLVDGAVEAVNAERRSEGRNVVVLEGGVEVVEREMQNRAEQWGCTRRFVHGSWRRVR